MEALTTNGIRISVKPKYEAQYSKPVHNKYVFSYTVTIENQSSNAVQLLRRHWHIWDASGNKHEVEGEGVIGKQPIIEPGHYHQYASWCELESGIGKMYGSYLMQQQHDGHLFEARIPVFLMYAYVRMN